jgi:hypothetical protein
VQRYAFCDRGRIGNGISEEAGVAMDTRDNLTALYTTAVRLSLDAFAAGHYAMAYHALAAAMHGAFDLGDEQRLDAVTALAQEQNAWLAQHAPHHELSAQAALTRGSNNLWSSLQREVETRRHLLHTQQRLRQANPAGTS